MDNIPYQKLPDKAKDFIEKYFYSYYVFKITFSSSYNAVFKGGSSIIFNMKGEWNAVIGNGNKIPFEIIEKFAEDNIIEKEIIKTIKDKYRDFNIYKVAKRKNKYEIEINKSIIIIDKDGNIIKTKNV
ncbi:PepSY-like domain-containing protein [uncultured Brachyspira sp.]|uniref:PepSY-like domain-containing protein n=1 Tax=uncultured Brachyspira sp. TaxID=221953 RepID=UPI0025DA6D06|nr:PepSY-like domain-containing protein [uncultured Brachyspira sp.]